MKLLNKKAVVTELSRRIGMAIALALAREGTDLTLIARDHKELENITIEARELEMAALLLHAT